MKFPPGAALPFAASRFCYFHNSWSGRCIQLNRIPDDNDATFNSPILEDAHSIQIALMRVMHLILSFAIDAKPAGLLTGSLNLGHTDLEPLTRERVVVDPSAVHETSIGENPWEADDFDDANGASLRDEAEDEDEEDEETDAEDEMEDEDEEDEPGDDEDEPPLYVEDGTLGSGMATAPAHQP